MKTLLLSTILSICTLVAFGQDIITPKNGDKIKAKVLEISTEEVKYKKFDNQEGPTYTLKKEELLGISYANGDEEFFKIENKGSKRMFIWGPSVKKMEFPKLEVPKGTPILIVDNRKTPPAKSIVEFSSKELLELIESTLSAQSGQNITLVRNKTDLNSAETYINLSIEAYDATFYPGNWHTQTRYFVEVIKDGKKHLKEIESLKGAFNTFGQSTAKARLTKSFEEATSQLIDFINSQL